VSAWDAAAKAWPQTVKVDQEFVDLLTQLARRVDALAQVPEPELQRLLSLILAREAETGFEIQPDASFDMDFDLNRYLDLCARQLAATAEEASSSSCRMNSLPATST
jgi:hypothetical protein